jgi:hypothetical protein
MRDNRENVIEAEPWAAGGNSMTREESSESTPSDPAEFEDAVIEGAQSYQGESANTEAGDDLRAASPAVRSPREEAIFTIRLLTAVSVGAVVEGGDQLVKRLKQYEEELRLAGTDLEAGETGIDEDELDRLRYATIGLLFDTQSMIGRSLELAWKAAETGVAVTEKISGPFWNFPLFRPFTKRVEKRMENMAEHGQDSLARWIAIGRQVEPRGRRLATFTYEEIVSEFINRLAENPEVRALVAQQSISLAAGMRDEVRERTVTSDNVLEDIARRILRREPRTALPQPPPEVQRWAGISPEDMRELERKQTDEQQFDSAK